MAGLFGGPKLKKPDPVKAQPDPNDPRIMAAKRRRVALAQQASGIRSSVLTRGGKETLGG